MKSLATAKKSARKSFLVETTRFLFLSVSLALTTQSAFSQKAQAAKDYVADEILASIKPDTGDSDLQQLIKEWHGTVVEQFSNRNLKFVRIKIDQRYFNQSYNKMSKDNHVEKVQLNYVAHQSGSSETVSHFPSTAPNDPLYPMQYQFAQMNVVEAWEQGVSGDRTYFGNLDQGVPATQTDLTPRVLAGINVTTKQPANYLNGGPHATLCTTCAVATTNNGILGAGVAYKAKIVPVDVSPFTDANIIKGLMYLESQHVWFANISLNSAPPKSLANPTTHPALWAEFNDYYQKGGLIFNSAGDKAGAFDPSPRTNQLVVIAGTDSSSASSNSTYGNPVWFAAPSKDVVKSDPENQAVTSTGTSFSSPLAMSVALLIHEANPHLSNANILEVMQKTATQPPGYNQAHFGYGIPNAGAAVTLARHTKRH